MAIGGDIPPELLRDIVLEACEDAYHGRLLDSFGMTVPNRKEAIKNTYHSVFTHLCLLGSNLPPAALQQSKNQELRGHVCICLVSVEHADRTGVYLRVCPGSNSGAACRRPAVASSCPNAAIFVSILAVAASPHPIPHRRLSRRCRQFTAVNATSVICFPPSNPFLIVFAVFIPNNRQFPFCGSSRPLNFPPEVPIWHSLFD